MAQHLQPKTVVTKYVEYEFEHAWKNGVWNCVEPVSFDLTTIDGINDKAMRWLGRLTALSAANEQFCVHLVLGEPQDETLKRSFRKAVELLKHAPLQPQIWFDDHLSQLSERIVADLKGHEVVTH